MSLLRLVKIMKSFIWQRKFISFIFLILIVVIPVIVFADSVNEGYKAPANYITTPIFHCSTDSRDSSGNCLSIYQYGTCIKNNSSLNYFVSTKTLSEWNSFLAHLPSSVVPIACDKDGLCDVSNGETCSNAPTDCGACVSSYCGDFLCMANENSTTCPTDCPGCCVTLQNSYTYSSACSTASWNCAYTGGGYTNPYCPTYVSSCSASTYFGSANTGYPFDTYNSPTGNEKIGNLTAGCRAITDRDICNSGCFWVDTLPKCNLWCGDGACNNGETCNTCAGDCGTCIYKCVPSNGSTDPHYMKYCGSYTAPATCPTGTGCSWILYN